MHDLEAPEGASVVSRPNCECHGETCVKNGRGGWRCAVKARETNRACAARDPVPRRARAKKWKNENRDRARASAREYRRRKLGWYTENGMATKPTQFKELNNG